MTESSGGVNHVFATVFLITFVMFAVEPILPLYLSYLGASLLEIGVILSIRPLTEIFVLLPLSELSRRIGRETVVAFACGCQAFCVALYAGASSISWFYLIGMLASMIQGAFAPAAYGIIVNVSARRQLGNVMGKYFTSVALGMTLGPLVSGILVQELGFRNCFFIMALLPTAGIVLMLSSKKRSQRIEVGVESSFRKSVGSLLRNRTVFAILVVEVLFSITVGSCNVLLPTYFSESMLLAPSSIGILFALRGLSNAALRLPAGRLSDRIGARRVLISALVFSFAALLLLTFTRNTMLLAFAMIVYGGGWGIRVVSMSALLAETAPREHIVVSWATVYMALNIGTFMGTFLAGMANYTASMNVLFVTALLLAPAVLASIFSVPSRSARGWATAV